MRTIEEAILDIRLSQLIHSGNIQTLEDQAVELSARIHRMQQDETARLQALAEAAELRRKLATRTVNARTKLVAIKSFVNLSDQLLQKANHGILDTRLDQVITQIEAMFDQI